MKIEFLYPKATSLYGDQGNQLILRKALPGAHFHETDLNSEPYFVRFKPDLIVMGSMTEHMQLKIIERLMPYRHRLQELIDSGVSFLITGNALDVFGTYIEDEKGFKHPGLDIFPFYTKQDLMHRHNSLVLGKFRNVEMVAFKTLFAQLYPLGMLPHWMNIERGTGFHVGSKVEGIQKNRFYGTQCVGPVLILNPYFTLELLKGMGIAHPKLPYQEVLMASYHQRLAEFRDPKIINYP